MINIHKKSNFNQKLNFTIKFSYILRQQTSGPFPPRLTTQVHEFSSDGDSDEE